MTRTIEEIFRARTDGYASEKWSSYLTLYNDAFAPMRDRPVNVLEIGVQNGGSLEVWASSFPKARKIVGVDVNPKCVDLKYSDPRISIVVGDAAHPDIKAAIAAKCAEFDIIIDDGSHHSRDVIRAFAHYFPLLSDGGLYVVEDMHASYWKTFEGGLYYPYSSLAFFKRLTDLINAEHWESELSGLEAAQQFGAQFHCSFDGVPLENIHSITFTNSVCIISKRQSSFNALGVRVGSGADDGITKIDLSAETRPIKEPDEWSTLARAEGAVVEAFASLPRLKGEIERLQAKIDSLQRQSSAFSAEIERLKQRLTALHDSTSWRITKPLRYLASLVYRLRS
ncbi:CmcI family methyltransferase [Bradyrhizobium sp. Ai1a-2]|uniref:CmcI family methyltransferase n=1 Tax=Bradyrhizobium sp. Ai1a-2 TaxID=196490 RepID=UPI00041130BF|nr:CmcI family methyltransferase [Bradyrhizobium sp. Ai1a-2]